MLPNSMQGFSWEKKKTTAKEQNWKSVISTIFFKVSTQVETVYGSTSNCKKKSQNLLMIIKKYMESVADIICPHLKESFVKSAFLSKL